MANSWRGHNPAAMLDLEANRPAGHSSPLSRPLLLLPHCPVDGPQAFCCMHFCTSQNCQEILRCARFGRGNYASAADENSSPSSGVMHSCINCNRPPSLLSPLCQLVQPRQLLATDLFCRLGRVVVVVTPFSHPASSRPHCSSSLRSGSTTEGFLPMPGPGEAGTT